MNTCGGGGLQPKVIEVNKMENIVIGGLQEHQAVKIDGVCTTLTSSMGTGGGYVPMVIDKQIVRMIGRDKDNPSDRTVGNQNLEQRLEQNTKGTSNTITSVQKDNLVLEKQTVKICEANKKGYAECEIGGVADLNYTSSTTRRGRVQSGGADKSSLDNGEYP